MNTMLTKDKVSNKFTDAWWNNFADQTENFSKHFNFKKAFNEEEVDHINQLVEDVIKKVASDKKRRSYLRIWKDGKYDENKFFDENPIQADESILEWKNRIFDNEKFGLFLNHANNHSEQLSELITKFLQPYFEKKGLPIGGFSTTIILGDYGWTPLGIHRDKIGEYIVHFHLGPGAKDIYIWNSDKSEKHGYVNLKRTENFDDFINDYSYKSSFEKGDIFSMLGKNVHIGNTTEFSIGLVIEFNGLTEKELLEKMWFKLGDELLDKNFTGNKAKILPEYDDDNKKKYYNYILTGIKHHKIDIKQSLKTTLATTYKDHKYALLSNKGFTLPPYVDLKKAKKEFKKITVDSSIKLVNSYKVLFYEEDNNLTLFIRGEKFRMQTSTDVITFINHLNDGNVLTVKEVKENFFIDWNDASIFKLLYVFYQRKGIEILD